MSKRPASTTIHLRGEDSGGHLALIEHTVTAGLAGPPLHVHPLHAEGFYVLEGELTFQVRDQLKTGPAGTFVSAPAGTPHTFANLGRQDARLLITCTPAGFEPYFDRLARGEAAEPPPSQAIAVGPPIRAQT